MSDLLTLLRDCYDPVTRRNITEAGLVQSWSLTPDTEAAGRGIAAVAQRHIAKLCLYAPGINETINAQFIAQIENRLLGVQSISRVEITLLPSLFPIL
jgi:metal-sulfur cluster biosynthetic enzyme